MGTGAWGRVSRRKGRGFPCVWLQHGELVRRGRQFLTYGLSWGRGGGAGVERCSGKGSRGTGGRAGVKAKVFGGQRQFAGAGRQQLGRVMKDALLTSRLRRAYNLPLVHPPPSATQSTPQDQRSSLSGEDLRPHSLRAQRLLSPVLLPIPLFPHLPTPSTAHSLCRISPPEKRDDPRPLDLRPQLFCILTLSHLFDEYLRPPYIHCTGSAVTSMWR